MLGMRLARLVVLACVSLVACAGGAEGPSSSSSAFDPTQANDGTGPATTTGTGSDDGTTVMPPADVTGDPPPDGSCCEVAPTPGCGNPEVETCVCTIDPACCQAVWGQGCVELAIDPCGDPACLAPGSTGEPGDGSSSGGPPTLACDALAMQEGWMYWRCQAGSGSQCNDMGTPTTDCDFCCGYCNAPSDVSCGDLATMNGWAPGTALCEWNGNGACGGQGTPTCDCNFCCQAN